MGHLTVLTGNIAGNLTKIFQKSQIPGGLPGGGAWAVLELTDTLAEFQMSSFLYDLLLYVAPVLLVIKLLVL